MPGITQHAYNCQVLAPAAQVNQSLLVLDVSDNRLSEEAKNALVKAGGEREELQVVV